MPDLLAGLHDQREALRGANDAILTRASSGPRRPGARLRPRRLTRY